jgi:glycosyltransferase involved in cell wall biosynthesis
LIKFDDNRVGGACAVADSPRGATPSIQAAPPGGLIATSISLVLPMFNESPAVNLTLTQAVAGLERHFAHFEIVVADDASTDDSVELVQDWAARDARIRLVRLPKNQRFGGALRAGLSAAANELLFYMDFDLPIALGCLPELLTEFAEADVLTGYAGNHTKHANWQSAVISWGYNTLVGTAFGLPFRDINFGFKAVRNSVWKQLDLRSCSPFVDAELFVEAQRAGFRIKEVAVPFSRRQAGSSHIRRADVIAWTLLDLARVRSRTLRRPRSRAGRRVS